MAQIVDYQELNRILAENNCSASAIIAIMQDIQQHYHYLPQEALEYVAGQLDISPARIYSVATFYENFSLEPKGKHVIRVCTGTACHVRKSGPILEALQNELGLSDTKHTTDDMQFTLETVACLGACGLSPVMTINDVVYPSMTPEKALELLNKIREEGAENA